MVKEPFFHTQQVHVHSLEYTVETHFTCLRLDFELQCLTKEKEEAVPHDFSYDIPGMPNASDLRGIAHYRMFIFSSEFQKTTFELFMLSLL